MSRAELAAAVEVTRRTIDAIERGRDDPSLELAFAPAAHSDRAIEDVFDPASAGGPGSTTGRRPVRQ